ncbi:tyrosine/nicotianamine aminotransferase (macronuclear) [Tetrahymena thermophila SB210]|uniref:Tyrosine/nicotianamine aminotransferase n=1 Tax=Tetrahymena thermophila (strain SB210) TaxID=312017 RepID=Q23DS3_TETTS|nr:tyrosine/nicotianamine aminotransferase [Tetrahymena thermophila SB210]EAR94442.1 tyrosine/nicotianamine aminotransferase [Tetrahymena thermophila SB210]|eukprot:XP_001014613.1 tyrosine/nicotianamine aminotransferase [Tetrahymena thermophila SB210]
MSDFPVFQAAERIKNTCNPIRNYVESVLPKIDITLYKDTRPADNLNLTLGDPTLFSEFQTNPEILQKCADGVGKIDGYTDLIGKPEIRQAVAERYKFQNNPNVKVDESDVFLTFGCSMGIYLSVATLANPGDNFLFPSPGFPLMVTVGSNLGIDAKFYDLMEDKDWEANLEQMEKLIDDKTRFIYICNPSNPLSSLWTKKHMLDIIDFCKRHNNLPIVADETYEHMPYPGEKFYSFGELTDTVPVVIISGMSKRWLVPGWRTAWLTLVGKKGVFDEVKQGLRNLLSFILMPNTIVAGNQVEMLKMNDDYIDEKMRLCSERFKLLKELVHDVKGIKLKEAKAAFYAAVGIDYECIDITSSQEFATKLLQEENVSVFPGELFFGKNFFRIIMCADEPVIREFSVRIRRFCERHQKKQ